MAERSRNQLAAATEAFVNAQTWSERKSIVEAERDLLLTDEADLDLASALEQFRDNAKITRLLEECRELLACCRRLGIEEAFADYLHTEESLKLLLDEINRLRNSSDLPRRVDLSRTALRLVNRDTQAQLWAELQNTIADSLAQSPFGEKADNLEQAIFHYQQACQVFTHQAFPEVWARIQNNLAVVYTDRPRGERADNLEQAIYFYKQALQVHTQEVFPAQWAALEDDLVIAYQKRIRGERADNLEQAISHAQQALQVFTRQTFPERWANTQSNLANAYTDRIRGERADNLEQAIFHYQQALQVFTRQVFPKVWAMIQSNLANAYTDRIRGERANNLEQAIRYFEQALGICTHQNSPIQWAIIQHNLADAYQKRIRGEQADNLEQAILLYEQALQVRTRQTSPDEWALTQNNLAHAYTNRIRGERADNVEQAILLYQQALEVRTRQASPEQWALTQIDLAIAYRERIRGERADNLEQALHYYEQALEVYTRQAFPEKWAWTQYNRGNTYLSRIRGERADNVEQAILLYQQTLQVRTRQAFPEQWATTQNNLAVAYWERLRGERADNLKQAIRYFEQALEVYTPVTFPQNCRNSAYSLGRLLYDEHRFSEARRVLVTAHQAVEALRGEVQRDSAKQSLSEENADLYARLVSCCLRQGDIAAAYEYVSAGKGRAFVDLLATVRFNLSAASSRDSALADDLRKARELRQQIDNLLAILTDENRWPMTSSSDTLNREISSSMPSSPNGLYTQLSHLQALEKSHWEEMAYKYPTLTATQKTPALSLEQACELAGALNATLVEYYRHAEGWCAFIVTSSAMYHVPLPLIDDNLIGRMVKWLLRIEYAEGRKRLSYTRLSEWYEAVVAPLETYLLRERPVVMAPFDVLHVLPLTAARHSQTGRYIAEDYQLSFAPSLSALRTVWDRVRRADRGGYAAPRRLLSVAYPGMPGSEHYLPNVLAEAQVIAGHFSQVTQLYQKEATPEAVLMHSRNQDAVHFGCHGWFDAERPEQSGLMLADGWLTIQRIITEFHLEQAEVATLGACLSGRVALQRGDEHVGLLQATMTAGAKAVVSSLWPVDDAATRVLFETFYAELVAGRSPALAMKEAARRVREYPDWKHPYYWAAFQVSGLAHGWQEKEK